MEDIFKEAIEELKRDIAEKQDCIKILKEFDSKETITSEEYHKCCQTALRYSDVLGKKLLKVFPFLTYEGKTAGKFCYKFTDSDIAISVKIPQYDVNAIELVVDNYYETEDEIRQRYEKSDYLDMSIVKQEVYALDNYFEEKFSRKAKMCYPYIRFPFCLIAFKFAENRKDKEMLHRLEKAKMKLKRLEDTKRRKIYLDTEMFRKQQKLFDKYIPIFLEWTDSVWISTENREVIKTICKEQKQ